MLVVNADARDLGFLPDESVDVVATSPPFYLLRSYRDRGQHYSGQIGSEPSYREYLETLWTATREWVRVLKPSGSIFIEIGDKYSGAGGPGGDYDPGGQRDGQPRIDAQEYWSASSPANSGIRSKSLMGLPWRYALGCIDNLGLILRAEIVWERRNGLPESVTDRVRRSHSTLFHFVKSERYYSAVDEIREEYLRPDAADGSRIFGGTKAIGATDLVGAAARRQGHNAYEGLHDLGKLPGSVWPLSSEPLRIPDYFLEVDGRWESFWRGSPKKDRKAESGGLFDYPDVGELVYPGYVDLWRMVEGRYLAGDTRAMMLLKMNHFAAMPSELVRRIVLGWSPPAVCLRCGEGRWPVVDRDSGVKERETPRYSPDNRHGGNGSTLGSRGPAASIVGYACACTPFTDHPENRGRDSNRGLDRTNGNRIPRKEAETRGSVREYHLTGWTPPPSRPAVVLDPFGGTGTTVGVANALGRDGVMTELSEDYCRLAKWRISQPDQWRKATERTWQAAQGVLL
jgi:DNA modification methylase